MLPASNPEAVVVASHCFRLAHHTMAEATSKCHCSVPLCKSNKKRQPYLSFHGFPSDLTDRKKWIKAIRREEGRDFKILRGSTFVCSRHFKEADYSPASISGGRKRLKMGTVPCCFQWNNWGLSQRESVNDRAITPSGHDVRSDLSQAKQRSQEVPPVVRAGTDHDYAISPTPGMSVREWIAK